MSSFAEGASLLRKKQWTGALELTVDDPSDELVSPLLPQTANAT